MLTSVFLKVNSSVTFVVVADVFADLVNLKNFPFR